MREEKKIVMPEMPPLKIAFQKSLAVIGTQSLDIDALDIRYHANES